jgi:hypothetical protein
MQGTDMRNKSILLLTILWVACNLTVFIPDLRSAIITNTPGAEAGYTECYWN